LLIFGSCLVSNGCQSNCTLDLKIVLPAILGTVLLLAIIIAVSWRHTLRHRERLQVSQNQATQLRLVEGPHGARILQLMGQTAGGRGGGAAAIPWHGHDGGRDFPASSPTLGLFEQL
jgi:hypothetical protein